MKRILVCDDSSFMRTHIKSMVTRNGFEVIGEAEDGLDAIVKYRELKPDLVTMDITMPNMSGIDALKHIIKLDSDARVVMLSAMGQEALVKESILAGAKSFLVKPFSEDDLIKVLSKV
ncbi:MAG: response regulator [Clostridiales bacterium]|nr:response regulator [Clostridiales bacterium]